MNPSVKTSRKLLIPLGAAALAASFSALPAGAQQTEGHVAALTGQRNTANYIYAVAGQGVMTPTVSGNAIAHISCEATREPVGTTPMWMECFVRDDTFGYEYHANGPGTGDNTSASDTGVVVVVDWGVDFSLCARVYGSQLGSGWTTCTPFIA